MPTLASWTERRCRDGTGSSRRCGTRPRRPPRPARWSGARTGRPIRARPPTSRTGTTCRIPRRPRSSSSALACLVLAWRRRWPVTVLGVSVAAVTAYTLLGYLNGVGAGGPDDRRVHGGQPDRRPAGRGVRAGGAGRARLGQRRGQPARALRRRRGHSPVHDRRRLGRRDRGGEPARLRGVHPWTGPNRTPAAASTRNGCASPANCTTSWPTPWPPSTCRPGRPPTSCLPARRRWPNRCGDQGCEQGGARELRAILNVLRQADDAGPDPAGAGHGQLETLIYRGRRAGLDTDAHRAGEPLPLRPPWTWPPTASSRSRSPTPCGTRARPPPRSRSATVRDGLRIEVSDTGRGARTNGPAATARRQRRARPGRHARTGRHGRRITGAGPGPSGGFRVAARLPFAASTPGDARKPGARP